MKFFRLLSFSLEKYGLAFSLLAKHHLWIYLLYPLVLNILVFSGGMWLVSGLAETSLFYIQDVFGLQNLASEDANLGHTILYWLLWFVFKVLYFILFAFLSGSIILILMSPALALLSERTEKIQTGNDYPFVLTTFLRETYRGILLAIRNTFFQFAIMFALFLLGFVPVLGLIIPLALLVVSSYFYGFSFMDYYQERRKLSISESVRFMRANKGLAVGNGLPFALLLLLPFFGSIVASFFAVATTIAGTIAMHEKLS